MQTDLRNELIRALDRPGRPSSDYDLNADVSLPESRKLRTAAVLIAIRETDAGPRVFLTKRASTLKHHPGQIAFPGGKLDQDDANVVATACREAEEEIGLIRGNLDILGTLPCHETVTGFEVTPVIALVRAPFTPTPETGEVAEVFEVPLSHVLNRSLYSVEGRRWRGVRRAYFTVPWGPYYIWGATARMLCALADRMVDDEN